MGKQRLKMLKIDEYAGLHEDDPIKFYKFPFVGGIYRKRVESCLEKLSGGERVLEIGFGSGVAFFNLNKMYKEIHGLDLMADAVAVTEAFKKFGIKTFLINGNILSLPYPDGYFDSVLLISILEHLKPESLVAAFREIRRVLKHGGQVVYGVPVDKRVMSCAFGLLGYDINKYHFSSQHQVAQSAKMVFKGLNISNIIMWPFGKLYEIGCSTKQ